MKVVANVFLVVSIGLAVALAVWASINAIFFGDQAGGSFLAFFFLWLVTGGPLLVAGLFMQALRKRRFSMEMPSHLPDWKRK